MDHAIIVGGVPTLLTRETHVFGEHLYAPSDLDKLPRARKKAIGVYEVVRSTANLATTA